MTSCLFIFLKKHPEETFLSLRLDENEHIDAPLEPRGVEAIKNLQQNARTILILPAQCCSLFTLALPKLREQKLRATLPYALEDMLAQNLEELHFAFDFNFYQDGKYKVLVLEKQILKAHLDFLKERVIQFDQLSVDWFALKEGECCYNEHGLIIHCESFQGGLNQELSLLFLDQKDALRPLQHEINTDDQETFNQSFYPWLAKRLVKRRMINLCQGEFKLQDMKKSHYFGYRGTMVLAGLSCGLFLCINLVHLGLLNHKISSLDQDISIKYHEFFPEARQIVNPLFRIQQLLKNGANRNPSFWLLMNKLSLAFNENIQFEKLQFKSDALTLTLAAKDFASLEVFQRMLQKQRLIVNQKQASTHKQQVIAYLEIKT